MKFQASKKSDINIIDRIRFFLIKLLVGSSLAVMVNIEIVDGTVVLDEKTLVHACTFTGAKIEVSDKEWYEKLSGTSVERCCISQPKPKPVISFDRVR